MRGPVLGLGTDTKKVSDLEECEKAFREGSANFNGNPKEGMTDSSCGFSVEESWGQIL